MNKALPSHIPAERLNIYKTFMA